VLPDSEYTPNVANTRMPAYNNYPGGSGLTAGAVFGRRAGYAATEQAQGA
jgi:succinate dehydrogenase/fumarate reductase flavoprotein subunit